MKQRFLHVWHGTEQTIIDNAIDEWYAILMSGTHACVQKSEHIEQLL